ncbi:MAG: class I SAM-dependent methyltransferase [Legionella sp.]|nr:class I SAM-dependent methyltransferase [Legionella sp.]
MIEINKVGYVDEEMYESARMLAFQLQYELVQGACSCLFVSKDKLTLNIPGFLPLYADFHAQTWYHRRTAGKKQGLVKACKPAKGLKIIDATAGWGRDAAILSSLGAQVLMLERHPVMSLLLQDALLHQSQDDKKNLPLSCLAVDAVSYFKTLPSSQFPDVIYIDPMHPQRTKSALVKKDMQALQQLIGADKDALELIQCALNCAQQRVVVKWPQKLRPLLAPSMSIEGKTIRFDIYLSSKKVNS